METLPKVPTKAERLAKLLNGKVIGDDKSSVNINLNSTSSMAISTYPGSFGELLLAAFDRQSEAHKNEVDRLYYLLK